MQFGRLHGVILVLLGGLLLLVQVFLTFQGLVRSANRPQPTDQSAQAESRTGYRELHPMEYIPALAGVGLAIFGTIIIVRRQKEVLDEFSKQHPSAKAGVRRATPR